MWNQPGIWKRIYQSHVALLGDFSKPAPARPLIEVEGDIPTISLPYLALRPITSTEVVIYSTKTRAHLRSLKLSIRPTCISLNGKEHLCAAGASNLFVVYSIQSWDVVCQDVEATETEIVQFVGDILIRTTRRATETSGVNISTIWVYSIHTWQILLRHELPRGHEFNLGTYSCLAYQIDQHTNLFFSNIWNTIDRKSGWSAWTIFEDPQLESHTITKIHDNIRNVITARVINGVLHVLLTNESNTGLFMWRPSEQGGMFPIDLSPEQKAGWVDERGHLCTLIGDFISDYILVLIPRDPRNMKLSPACRIRWKDHERRAKCELTDLPQFGELTLHGHSYYASRLDCVVDWQIKKPYFLILSSKKIIVYVVD